MPTPDEDPLKGMQWTDRPEKATGYEEMELAAKAAQVVLLEQGLPNAEVVIVAEWDDEDGEQRAALISTLKDPFKIVRLTQGTIQRLAQLLTGQTAVGDTGQPLRPFDPLSEDEVVSED